MSPEHVFAIRLFLAASGIAFAGVAVNQADWKHPLFVRSLFGCAGVLFIAAVFWPAVAPAIPEGIGSILNFIASSLISYLLLLAVTVVAICGLDYRERAKWRAEFPRVIALLESGVLPQTASKTIERPQSDNRQWVSSYKIFDLGDSSLVQKTLDAQSVVQRLAGEISDNEIEQAALKSKDPLEAIKVLQNPPPELVALKATASKLHAQNFAADKAYNAAFGELLTDIYEKLSNGKLIAKGFLIPVESGSSEIEIPPAHWRLIRFHAAGYTQAEGQGIKYVGVTVARA